MSKYHKQCCGNSAPVKKQILNKKPRIINKVNIPKTAGTESKPINMVGLLANKPFCDCDHCVCRNCPDVLKMLSITVSDTTCHFGSKVSPAKEELPKPSEPAASTLLDVINQERDCNCSVVARGIRDHVHMNLGMSKRRDSIKEKIELCDKHCLALAKGASSKIAHGSRSVVRKDNAADAPDEVKCPICESMARGVFTINTENTENTDKNDKSKTGKPDKSGK